LEAMACGVPSIVTNTGGLPYIAEKNKTSLIVNERSSKEIECAIRELYHNDGLRDNLGIYSYEYVRKNFSKEIIGRKLYEFYENVKNCKEI
jgi:glycosyltransferase involved in cell wall biosynthesis